MAFIGPGFLLPTRDSELFRWSLDKGLRVVQPITLMSLGLYDEPAGAFLLRYYTDGSVQYRWPDRSISARTLPAEIKGGNST